MARTKAKSVKPKFSEEVKEIFSQLKNDGVKLSMLKEATLIHKLTEKHNIKPTVIEKEAKMSLPHVYNLIRLAAIPSSLKAYVRSGKLKGTDVLNIIRKGKSEKDFIKMADKIASSKVDRRLKENRENNTAPEKKTQEQLTNEPKRGRGRPRKEKATSVVVTDNVSGRKEKIKELILNYLGKKITKTQNNSLDLLVESLIANN
jgi:hypothetical protein